MRRTIVCEGREEAISIARPVAFFKARLLASFGSFLLS